MKQLILNCKLEIVFWFIMIYGWLESNMKYYESMLMKETKVAVFIITFVQNFNSWSFIKLKQSQWISLLALVIIVIINVVIIAVALRALRYFCIGKFIKLKILIVPKGRRFSIANPRILLSVKIFVFKRLKVDNGTVKLYKQEDYC